MAEPNATPRWTVRIGVGILLAGVVWASLDHYAFGPDEFFDVAPYLLIIIGGKYSVDTLIKTRGPK